MLTAGFFALNSYIYEQMQAVTGTDHINAQYIVFLLTQTTGGSGIYYYAVAALNTERGYGGNRRAGF